MEGLEVTELLLSEVSRDNKKLRLDSGYFAKPMLAAHAVARSYAHGHVELGAIFSRFVKGIFDINADSYSDAGVPFLRILNLKGGLIDDSNLALIPESIHAEESKTELRRSDIVLSKTAYPAASLVTLDRCNTSQDTIATTLSSFGKSVFKPEVVVAYLNSAIGQRLLWRQFQGNVQLHLSLDDGRKVPIPKLGADLQRDIASAYKRAEVKLSDARKSYAAAETALIGALELDTKRAPDVLSYQRGSTDVFTAGRLDAQFFAPHVERLLKRLGRDGLKLADVAPARHERFVPARVGDFRYIEIGGLGNDGTARAEALPQREAPSRATQYVRTDDVITSTVRPIRRLSALIDADQDGCVCSSGFVVLRSRDVLPEVLLTYLRLAPVCELMDLHTSATMYPAISEADLLALPIPAIAPAAQAGIRDAVRAAARSRQRATLLLECAKRAVEIAIEESEDAAMAHLKEAIG